MKRFLPVVMILLAVFATAFRAGLAHTLYKTMNSSEKSLKTEVTGLAVGRGNSKNYINISVSTRSELLSILDEYARNLGRETLSISCSKELWKEINPERDELLSRYLYFNCGIRECECLYTGQKRRIVINKVDYYPGWRIVHAAESGRVDELLTSRERDTYEIARTAAEQMAGKTELEKELMVHDVLCKWVTYKNDETTDEDDCAIGAILNRAANCDGYSDAFYLLCELAGLEASYMGYDVVQKDGTNDENHVWNLVRVDGKWAMVDVTWDDTEADMPTVYAYFNIGPDRAAWTHIWDERTVSVPWVEKTDPAIRTLIPMEEMEIHSVEAYSEAARRVASYTGKQIVLMPDDAMQRFLEENGEISEAFQHLMAGNGISTFGILTVSGGKYKLVHDIEYYPEIVAAAEQEIPVNSCRSREEMVQVVGRVMGTMPDSFVIWYRDGYDFSSNSMDLSDAIQQAGAMSFSWSYNYAGRVEVSEIQYYPEIEKAAGNGEDVLSFTSQEEMERAVRNVMSTLPDSFVLWYRGGYDFPSHSEDLSSVLYQMGCMSFTWSSADTGRVEVSEIIYYPEFEEAVRRGTLPTGCASKAEMEEAVHSVLSEKPEGFVLWYRNGYAFEANCNDLSHALYAMGCKSFSWGYTPAGRVEVSKIQYYPEFCVCETKDELSDYLSSCASRHVSEFRVYLPAAIYAQLQEDGFMEWFRYLKSISVPEAYTKTIFYSDTYGMIGTERSGN